MALITPYPRFHAIVTWQHRNKLNKSYRATCYLILVRIYIHLHLHRYGPKAWISYRHFIPRIMITPVITNHIVEKFSLPKPQHINHHYIATHVDVTHPRLTLISFAHPVISFLPLWSEPLIKSTYLVNILKYHIHWVQVRCALHTRIVYSLVSALIWSVTCLDTLTHQTTLRSGRLVIQTLMNVLSMTAITCRTIHDRVPL